MKKNAVCNKKAKNAMIAKNDKIAKNEVNSKNA